MNLGKRQMYLLMNQSATRPLDHEVSRRIQQHREKGFGWRYDGLGDWTTEAIFDKLRELGVDTSADRFAAQAQAAGRCAVLEAAWVEDLELEGFAEDFPFLASEELWERLTPDLLCPEILSNRLEAVIGRSRSDRQYPVPEEEEQAQVDMAVSVATFLEGFPREDRADWFNDILDGGTFDYGSWLLKLVLNSGPRYPVEMTYVADIMSDCGQPEAYQGDLLLALAIAGWREEALDRIDLNLERFPEHVGIRLMAGDACEELGEDEKAVHLFAQALAMASEPDDWKIAAGRLKSLLPKLGRATEWEELKRRHPKPGDLRAASFSAGRAEPPRRAPAPSGPIGVLTGGSSQKVVSVPKSSALSGGKIGRNDPCPCGSGKKYKKCCLGRY